MESRFQGSRLKIERANQHISDLQAICESAGPDFYIVGIKVDPKTGHNRIGVHVTDKGNKLLAVIIGDALHNAKSALDLLVNEAVFLKTGTRSEKHTRFPVRDEREELVNAVNGGTIKPDLLRAVIIDEIKPCKAGNYPIWALHELNIMDKHKLLIPVSQNTIVRGVDVKGRSFTATNLTFMFNESNVTMLPIATSGPVAIENQGKATLHIHFGDGLPFEGKPIIPTLLQLAQVAAETIEIVERRLFS